MKNLLLLTSALAASSLPSLASTDDLVYSEHFNTPFAVTAASNAAVIFDGAATGDVEIGEWFSSSNRVTSPGTTLDFAQDSNQNRTRGAGVWLDAADWVAGTVTVTFDISGFTAALGNGPGALIQAYTASGVDASNTVSIDIHGGAPGADLVVLAATGTATIAKLGTSTAITADGTLTHTFTYAGEERIALVFANLASNGVDDRMAAFSLDNLTVVAQTTRPAQPNFIIIYADDLGWQDVGCYDVDDNAIFDTPYMDALAAEGALFWQGYSPAPTCAPSRGAMMAGKSAAALQRHHVAGGTVPAAYTASQRLIVPFYNGRLELAEVTIPEALNPLGYYSGHSGKWHMAIGHNDFPQPEHQGFDWSESDRGVSNNMADTEVESPVDLSGRLQASNFATPFDPMDPDYDATDIYRLDANGFAFDLMTQNALDFMTEAVTNQPTKPFFLYYASWLVHGPFHMRTQSLLEKYMGIMGYIDTEDADPTNDTFDDVISTQEFVDDAFSVGQTNPFYGAMVERFDYNVHQIVNYLKTTPDPRWAGHMLFDNTYIFLTSDNGGMEKSGEHVTDNYPLDGGKIKTEEGGTRVPFIVVGPGVAANVQSDVMVSGLDFHPTMLAMAGGTPAAPLEGCDLTDLLRAADPTDSSLVTHIGGGVRDALYWHFPQIGKYNSTIRKDGWKLFQNYDHVNNESTNPYRLYELYDSAGAPSDLNEAIDVYDTDPAAVLVDMAAELNAWLTAVDAGVLSYNPNYSGGDLPNQDQVPVVTDRGDNGGVGWVTYETDKAQVVEANMIYTLNGGSSAEEWFTTPATIVSLGRVEATVPEGTTHYTFSLIDENNFLVTSEDPGFESDNDADSVDISPYVFRDVYIGPDIELYNFDFETPETISAGGGLLRDSSGFNMTTGGAWGIADGVLSNSSLDNSKVSEGAVAQIFNISALTDTGFDELTISFDYTIAEAGEILYMHLWGYEEATDPETASAATTQIMNFAATNGSAWEKTTGEDPLLLAAYNLGQTDGAWTGTAGAAADAAAVITGAGSHTYEETFVLSDFTTAPGNLSLYDYLAIGFARKISGDAPAVTIDNLKITVPNRDGYVVWAYEAGLNDFSAASATSDVDFDGLNNLMEYGLGGNPEQADSDILPGFDVNTEETDEWTFTYRRRIDADAVGLTYAPECKKDLGNDLEAWSSVGITQVSAVAIDATYELVTCSVDVSGGVTEIFLRLAVEQAP